MLSGWVEKWNEFRKLQYHVLISEWFTLRTYQSILIHIFSSLLSNLYNSLIVPQKSSDETTGDEMTDEGTTSDIQDRVQIHSINMTLMQHSTTRIVGYIQEQVKDAIHYMTLMPEPLSSSKIICTGCPDAPMFELNPVTLELRVIPAVGSTNSS